MKRGIFILGFLSLIVLNGHSQFMQTITSADGRFLLNKIEAPLLGSEQIKNTLSIDTVYFNDQIQFQKIFRQYTALLVQEDFDTDFHIFEAPTSINLEIQIGRASCRERCE
jgi:hypothetical protein